MSSHWRLRPGLIMQIHNLPRLTRRQWQLLRFSRRFVRAPLITQNPQSSGMSKKTLRITVARSPPRRCTRLTPLVLIKLFNRVKFSKSGTGRAAGKENAFGSRLTGYSPICYIAFVRGSMSRLHHGNTSPWLVLALRWSFIRSGLD
jgi:hypothetical protein